ncbi:MAG TPA: substrate-binding domain-containing protein [Granulicella sp.]|jgi:ribose transport system substrate-binding protein
MMRHLTNVFGSIVCAGALLCSAGCTGKRSPRIAVIPETTAEEIWESEHAGVEAAAGPLHWDIYWNGPSREDDITRQIQLVDHAIDNGAQGLILSPDHAFSLIDPVRAALLKGIPTVILGTPLAMPSSSKLVFILNDDQAGGRLAATRASLYLKPGDAVAVLGVDPNLLGSIDRADAFERVIRQKDPQVKIIEERSTSFSVAEAEETAEEVIRSEPNLRVILTLNVNQSRGAYQAWSQAGASNHIKLIGYDQDLDLMNHLRAGDIDSLIAENTFQMGADAVQSLQAQMLGRSSPNRILEKPVLVTRENADSEPVQHVLDMNWTRQ